MKLSKLKILIGFMIVLLILVLPNTVLGEEQRINTENVYSVPEVSYRTHVQDIGWQEYVHNSETAGTSGQSKRLEGINVKLINNDNSIGIKYQVHVQDIGWQDWKENDEMAGTSGQSKRLEGIKINLINSNEYTVMYRVHVQDIGWQDWKKDGELAGTTGEAKRLEAIEIKITPRGKVGKICIDTPTDDSTYYNIETPNIKIKGWKMSNIKDSYIKAYIDNSPVDLGSISYYKRQDVINAIAGYGTEIENPTPGFEFNANIANLLSGKHTLKIELYYDNTKLTEQSTCFNVDSNLYIKYQAHVQNIGWQEWKNNDIVAGTEGQALRVEALKMQLKNKPNNVHIKYRAHVQNIGWQDWKTDGEIAGTEGEALRIEAIQVKIEGIDGYVVEYKSHVQNIGWQPWASDEMISGTVLQSLRVEAIKLRIVKLENTVVPRLRYSTYTTNQEYWSSYYNSGSIAGSESNNNKIESIKILLENVSGNSTIKYKAHSANVGWQDYVSNNSQAGVTEANKAIEAMRIQLDGLSGYSVEYRVYVNGDGWKDWVRDGATSGTVGESKQIGAIQIKLNIDAYPHNESDYSNMNTARYPGYKELLDEIQANHPNWSLKLLYTGLNFSDAVNGEYSNHGANLVPYSWGREWVCSICGTKSYDTGSWYCASHSAIAYYMDPRNFLNETNIFQFLDANKYEASSVSLDGIQAVVNGTFLQNYAWDVDTACKNQGVNPYYVISRLIQENGSSGSSTSRGMDGGDGKIYYNPFNIGAYKTANASVLENALAKAKYYGWDTMEKALEGGIVFLKENWLENYQNTLYQNRFDIDSTNGTSLYSHQYMQNLAAAYSEGLLLRSYYNKADKTNTNLTFIIPVYEGMSSTLSQRP